MGKTKKTDIRQLLEELGATGIEEGDFGLEKATLEGKSREDLLTQEEKVIKAGTAEGYRIDAGIVEYMPSEGRFWEVVRFFNLKLK